jgi:hypothetical protein
VDDDIVPTDAYASIIRNRDLELGVGIDNKARSWIASKLDSTCGSSIRHGLEVRSGDRDLAP